MEILDPPDLLLFLDIIDVDLLVGGPNRNSLPASVKTHRADVRQMSHALTRRQIIVESYDYLGFPRLMIHEVHLIFKDYGKLRI